MAVMLIETCIDLLEILSSMGCLNPDVIEAISLIGPAT